MRIACGVDIVDLSLITSLLNDKNQLERILLPGDINNNNPEHIAGRVALKEATIKALGLEPNDWLAISISANDSGKPIISVQSVPDKLISMDGSISHHGNMVVAYVVALIDDEN